MFVRGKCVRHEWEETRSAEFLPNVPAGPSFRPGFTRSREAREAEYSGWPDLRGFAKSSLVKRYRHNAFIAIDDLANGHGFGWQAAIFPGYRNRDLEDLGKLQNRE
jgi:hypothetical protein